MRTKQWPGYNSEISVSEFPYFEIFLPRYRALVRPHLEYAIQPNCTYFKKDIYHLERTQQTVMRWMKGLRDLNYKDRLKKLKLQSFEKKKDTELNSQIDLKASQLFKFSRRQGLRRLSLRRLQQTRRTHRRRNSFACGVVSYWNYLPPYQLAFKDN